MFDRFACMALLTTTPMGIAMGLLSFCVSSRTSLNDVLLFIPVDTSSSMLVVELSVLNSGKKMAGDGSETGARFSVRPYRYSTFSIDSWLGFVFKTPRLGGHGIVLNR